MKKKGFTLMELLGVIVVLAVISVVAIPLVLNYIEDAKKDSAKTSAYSYVKGLNTAITNYELKNKGESYGTGIFSISELETRLGTNFKGDKPTEGKVCIGSDEIVTAASLKIRGYVINYDGTKVKLSESNKIEEIACDGSTDGTGDDTDDDPSGDVVVADNTILAKAKLLVYDDTGVCKTDGTTYNYMGGCYIKGATEANYVWYNGFMWRIMGINSDNTVRLITDENVTVLAFGPANTGLKYTTNEGYIHDWLNEYFYNNLNSTKSIIQEGGYFCSYATTSASVRENCSQNKIVTAKVGIIAMDEYLLANSSSSYLNIGQYFWTMTPQAKDGAWYVFTDGKITYQYTEYAFGIRPVINVDPNSIVTSGNGVTSDYYALTEDKITNATGSLSQRVTSGDYVLLEGKTYRVVDKADDGVKLILDGFYEETEGTVYTMTYGNSNTFTLDSGIGQKLNGDVLTWLGLSDSEKVVTTTYYQGDEFENGTAYQDMLKQSNGVASKIGLIQIGEMLSSQSATILTNNYSKTSSYNNSKNYSTMNKNSGTTYAWRVTSSGNISNYSVTTVSNAIRPVIVVKSDLNITTGTGTWNNPYQI